MAREGPGDGLLRWLIGGLIVGGVVLGLLVGAYAIGYNRGQDSVKTSAPQPATTPRPPAPPPPTAPALSAAARGKQLFTKDACGSCHSLTGSAGAGPALNQVAGSPVTLTDGTSVTADDAYLEQSITDPDAQIVKGYAAGVMAGAVAGLGLKAKPADVAALVAYLKTIG